VHPKRQVRAFYVAGGDVFENGLPADRCWDGFDNLARSVPLRPSAVRLAVNFHERSEEHTSELQSLAYLVCRLLLEKKKKLNNILFRSRTFSSSSTCSPTRTPTLLLTTYCF